jgi:hypothetical protein
VKNRGEQGYGHLHDSGPDVCRIRGFTIETNPLYTYCENHPVNNPGLVKTPIGPVYVVDDDHRRVPLNPQPLTRAAKLAEQDRLWSEWARTATTDTVPDRFAGEPMPDGTLADRPWWYDADGTLRDKPPDAEGGPGNEFGA